MTRRNKSIAAVFSTCIFALIVDKLFLSPGPSPAGAAPVPTPAGERVDAADAAAIVAENPVADASPQDRFGRRLRHVATRDGWSSEVERDAFAVPVTWPVFGAVQGDESRPTTGLTAGEAFRVTHRLTAVMAGTNGGYALINGSMVLVGQDVDGFTLVAVNSRSATLDRDGVQVVLEMTTGR